MFSAAIRLGPGALSAFDASPPPATALRPPVAPAQVLVMPHSISHGALHRPGLVIGAKFSPRFSKVCQSVQGTFDLFDYLLETFGDVFSSSPRLLS